MLKKSTIFYDKSLEDILKNLPENLRLKMLDHIEKCLVPVRILEKVALGIKISIKDPVPESFYKNEVFKRESISNDYLISLLGKAVRMETVVFYDCPIKKVINLKDVFIGHKISIWLKGFEKGFGGERFFLRYTHDGGKLILVRAGW